MGNHLGALHNGRQKLISEDYVEEISLLRPALTAFSFRFISSLWRVAGFAPAYWGGGQNIFISITRQTRGPVLGAYFLGNVYA